LIVLSFFDFSEQFTGILVCSNPIEAPQFIVTLSL